MSGSSEDELRRRDEPLSTSRSALRDRERELASVQQIVRVAGITVDLRDGFSNGKRTPEYLAIHGLPPDAVDSHTDWVARLHPEDRDHTVQYLLDAVNGTTEQFSSQYRIVRPSDGQVRWIAAEAQIERGPEGRPLRLVGAHIDVTDWILADKALRESE
jgi:PAS domain S-box-containing protein